MAGPMERVISFGLVSVPVRPPAVRDYGVHFHKIDKGSGSRSATARCPRRRVRGVDNADIEMGSRPQGPLCHVQQAGRAPPGVDGRVTRLRLAR